MDGHFSPAYSTLVSSINPNLKQIKVGYDVMMKKENINQRIRRLRIARGYSQQQLANAVGVSDASVSKWESEQSEPKSKFIPLLARALLVTSEHLLHGSELNIEAGPDLRGKVPLISWIQAGNWLEMEVAESERHSYYSHTANVGPRAFALRVIGDSMTSQVGKSIPDGSVVIVDPDITPVHGKVVVARLDDSNEATLKQLVIDGGQKYLKPFNNAYPMMSINGNCTIIGVVKQVVQDF